MDPAPLPDSRFPLPAFPALGNLLPPPPAPSSCSLPSRAGIPSHSGFIWVYFFIFACSGSILLSLQAQQLSLMSGKKPTLKATSCVALLSSRTLVLEDGTVYFCSVQKVVPPRVGGSVLTSDSKVWTLHKYFSERLFFFFHFFFFYCGKTHMT